MNTNKENPLRYLYKTMTVVLFIMLHNCNVLTKAEEVPELSKLFGSMTNFQSIKNAYIAAGAGTSVKYYHLRCQNDAFFVRVLSETNHLFDSEYFGIFSCGRWDKEYWCFENDSKHIAALNYHYLINENDKASTAFQRGNSTFYYIYMPLSSFGLSLQQHLNINDFKLPVQYYDDTHRCIIRNVTSSHGLIHNIQMDRIIGNHNLSLNLDYEYDKHIIKEDIPVEMKCTQGTTKPSVFFFYQIINIEFMSNELKQDRTNYMPYSLWASTNIHKVIYTNGNNYYVRKGTGLIPMDAMSYNKELNRHSRRAPYIYLIVTLFSTILLPVLFILANKNKTSTLKKG